MINWQKIEAVQRMQDFLLQHAQETPFPFDAFYNASGYSRRHADRLFKEFLHKTPRDYLRRIILSASAEELLQSNRTVLEIALSTNFDSHEGYTKAFSELFGISPSHYRRGKSFIPLFIPYPLSSYYRHLTEKESAPMENKTCLCMVIPVFRPKRKLIFLPSPTAHDYWSFCEENGCDWEGILNSIPAKFSTAAILTLPPTKIPNGYTETAAGIEVPLDYDGEIPPGYHTTELEPCEMLFFQSQPYTEESEFPFLIGEVLKAVEIFDYNAYGYLPADDLAPRFNFGGEAKTGARLAIPVKQL